MIQIKRRGYFRDFKQWARALYFLRQWLDIAPDKIMHLIAKRRGEGAQPGSVNRTVTELLRRILRCAEFHWEQKGLPRITWKKFILKGPKERVRELPNHEEIALVERLRADYLPAIRFLIVTGLRKRELVSLRWGHIDWQGRAVTVRGKGDKAATIPPTAEMRAILAPHATATRQPCLPTSPAAASAGQ